MQVAQKIKIGPFLVISSVLAVWTLLAAQPVQAHTLTNPSCGGLPTAADFFGDDAASGTAALSVPGSAGSAVTGTATPRKGTGESGEGNKNYYYAKITVPALTAGELVVTDTTGASATYSSEGILCGRQEGNVSSLPSYASAHISADNAAAAALRAQTTAAAADATGGSASVSAERTARSALNTAANALASYNSSGTLTGGIAHALRRAAAATSDTDATTALNGAADTAIADSNTARVASGRASIPPGTDGALTDDTATTEAGLLGDAAEDLRIAAHALDPNEVFNINTLISSGDEEYVVVMTVPEGGTPAVSVSFRGVMSTGAADGGSFTQNNQRDTYTLRATDSGLLTVRTTGNEVDTKGTLNDSAADIAMNAGSGGNFEIISPMDDDLDYTVAVEGQTRGERGDYGLKMEFGVAAATDLAIGTPNSDEMLEPGRADYFFFTTASGDAGYLFLTVQTEKHTDVTTETDTTGTLYGWGGQLTTDTDSGTDNNFLLRAPVSPERDYIVEVKGATSSTRGKYVLAATSQTADNRGTAPDMLDATPDAAQTLAAAGVAPYSIDVKAPGTLQVKTTGMTDTIGALYGPDGQQITTDDNSGVGTNFKITQYVGAGQYIVVVEGQTRATTGDYTLVVNFVEGATVDGPTTPTTPGTGTETEQELRNQIADLRDDLATCTPHVETDARGNLDDPNSVAPNNGYRSGVGLIRGWVCAANEVEVRIFNDEGVRVDTVSAPYGSARTDTAAVCDDSNNGFAAQYNYNHLAEGEYTAEAYADGRRIGEERMFEVVHLTEFASNDQDKFLRLDDEVQERGTCDIEDFPEAGDATRLRWEESLQNFVIEDAG